MNDLNTYLQSLSLLTSEGIEIHQGIELYNDFYDFISILSNDNNVTILYRGTNPSDVFVSRIFDTKNFARMMFMLGEKSHRFEAGHKPLICIDDCSIEVFEFLFKRLHDKICQLNFQNESTIQTVDKFLKDNPDIASFFSDESNKELFISTVTHNRFQKKRIKDYYFSLLHTIGKSAYGYSYFLSTSKSLNVAKEFQNDGIIVLTWIPNTEKKRQIIRFEDVNKMNETIHKMGLPIWNTSPYMEQEEICIKGGLLPHFIVGYAYKDTFVVNPSLLTQIQNKNNINTILKDGINIDQTQFDDEKRKTKYKGGFLCIDGEIYEIND